MVPDQELAMAITLLFFTFVSVAMITVCVTVTYTTVKEISLSIYRIIKILTEKQKD